MHTDIELCVIIIKNRYLLMGDTKVTGLERRELVCNLDPNISGLDLLRPNDFMTSLSRNSLTKE